MCPDCDEDLPAGWVPVAVPSRPPLQDHRITALTSNPCRCGDDVSAVEVCEARDRHYPTPEARALLAAKLAGFEDDASLREWIEKGRFS